MCRRPSRLSGSGRKTLPDVPEGWKSLPDVRQLSGGLSGCQGVVGRHSQMPLRGGRPSRMSRSVGGPPGCPGGLADARECSGGPPGRLGVVETLPRKFRKPSRLSGCGQKALPNVWEWWQALPDVREASRMSGRPCGCPGVVGSPSRMARSGPEALPDVWEWSGGTPGCSEVIRRPFLMCEMPTGIFGSDWWPSLMSRSGRKVLQDLR